VEDLRNLINWANYWASISGANPDIGPLLSETISKSSLLFTTTTNDRKLYFTHDHDQDQSLRQSESG
jgi:hypothetical protein